MAEPIDWPEKLKEHIEGMKCKEEDLRTRIFELQTKMEMVMEERMNLQHFIYKIGGNA